MILPAFFSFLDPLLFIFPFLFCFWCTCISPLVSAFLLLMSTIKFWPVESLINSGVFPPFHFYIFNCFQAFLLGSEKLVSVDMDGLRHRALPLPHLPVSKATSTCERTGIFLWGHLIDNGIHSFYRTVHQPITFLCLLLSSTNNQSQDLHLSARPRNFYSWSSWIWSKS